MSTCNKCQNLLKSFTCDCSFPQGFSILGHPQSQNTKFMKQRKCLKLSKHTLLIILVDDMQTDLSWKERWKSQTYPWFTLLFSKDPCLISLQNYSQCSQMIQLARIHTVLLWQSTGAKMNSVPRVCYTNWRSTKYTCTSVTDTALFQPVGWCNQWNKRNLDWHAPIWTTSFCGSKLFIPAYIQWEKSTDFEYHFWH